MDINNIRANLRGKLLERESLAKYTTWRIGGIAEYFYEPEDLNDLVKFFSVWPVNSEIIWLGGGSNVLIRDIDKNAVVIHIAGRLSKIELLDSGIIRVEAGVSCAKLIQFCLQQGLADGVFLAGIPGTIGGALTMNAGAFGGEIWQHVSSVETIDRTGVVRIRNAQEFKYGYRHVEGLQLNEWFVAGYLKFTVGDVDAARQKTREFWKKRLGSQPMGEFSCGSVFKNPQGDFAGRLIEECGLKGLQIGDAKISDKHANFIINLGNATASDIEQLMQLIMQRVFEKYGVQLEPEVKII